MSTPKFPSRFEQVEEIASTPLSRTYRAIDRLMKREVILSLPAVKAWSGWKGDARARLLREAQAIGKVQHEGIQPVLWVEEIEDGLLVVQPPPSGERLTDHVKQGPMSVEAVLRIGVEIGEALAAVHYAGIVHRCIGLDAVWIQASGKIRLGAFTYAKAFDDAMISTSLNHGVGKGVEKSQDAVHLPPYPAPELLAGRGADPRADVYALGCLMFRCLAGHDPLLSGDGMQMPDVRAARKDVPKALGEVIRRCMLVEKTARFPTAQAVVDALKALQVTATGGSGSASKWAGMAAAAVVAVGAIGFLMMPSEQLVRRDSSAGLSGGGMQTNGKVYGATYSKGHALLIGIGSAYGTAGFFDKLNGPDLEVSKVRDKLLEIDPVTWRDERITVLLNEQATGEAVRKEILRLQEETQEEDCVLVYFAGHGVKSRVNGAYHLVCANADRKDPTEDGATGFLDRDWLNFTGETQLPAKHVLIVADCCHSGKIFEEAIAERGERLAHSKHEPHRMSSLLRYRVVEFLGSSGQEAAKDSSKGEISLFCSAFLGALSRGANEKVPMTAESIFTSIQSRMTHGKSEVDQLPVFNRLEGGDKGAFTFFFGDK